MRTIPRLAACLCLSALPASALNVVFILADDLGYGELGCFGQQKIHTPHLDRLAGEGTRLTRHYSGAPVCAPARCTLMTGKHLGHAEIRGNLQAQINLPEFKEGQHPISADVATLPGVLKNAGFATAAIGKWGLGPVGSTGDPNKKGFDLFFGYNCQAVAHSYYRRFLWRNDRQIEINPQPIPGSARQPEGVVTAESWIAKTYSPDLMVKEARGFIESNKDKPFFLYLPFIEPHVSMHPPLERLDEYPAEWDSVPYRGECGYLPHPRPRAAYATMISDLDRHVGEVRDALEKAGVLGETLIVFTSDNGATHEGGKGAGFHIGGADPGSRSRGPRLDPTKSLPGREMREAGHTASRKQPVWYSRPGAFPGCHLSSMKSPFFLLGALLVSGATASPTGQITRPVETFADPSPPPDDPARQFAGQRTTDGTLVLTASNGFFDRGIRAAGTAAEKDAAGPAYITPDFAYLDQWTRPGLGARWHLWITSPGRLKVSPHLVTADAGSRFSFEIDGRRESLVTRTEKDPAKPQKELEFDIRTPGWHELKVTLEESKAADAGQLHRIVITGPAVADALLLRTRWRPSACHARFSSSAVKDPSLWVMSTRASPDAAVSSYSPVTTPFGYYGCSFNPDGTASGGANFSMWSYRKGGSRPQEEWSHMLASGSQEAIFGSYAHEGSGVKLRGDWTPFSAQREVTLALRRETARPWARWYGYYLDPATKRFRLYAAGSTWIGKSKPPGSLNPGAFVEQPGPPQQERSGDLRRDIQRRGWVLDDQKRWHVIDTMKAGASTGAAAKHWRTTADGWFSMGMGGMPRRPGPGGSIRLEPKSPPEWLNEQAVKDLQRLPADIGKATVTSEKGKPVRIVVSLKGLALEPGEKATISLFHGPEDCLTFDRDLGFEVKTRFWPQHSAPQPAVEGENVFELKDLAPGVPRHFRVLVESPRGRIWSFETTTFTPPA